MSQSPNNLKLCLERFWRSDVSNGGNKEYILNDVEKASLKEATWVTNK
jgi:hypothetical protein